VAGHENACCGSMSSTAATSIGFLYLELERPDRGTLARNRRLCYCLRSIIPCIYRWVNVGDLRRHYGHLSSYWREVELCRVLLSLLAYIQ
jgi:hypothetical protein